jgi:hypothetical protein
MKFSRLAILLAAALFASCGQTGTNTSIAPITTSNTNATMQLAVGTLNDSGLLYGAGTWLNVVTSFRNPTGTAAFFHPSTTGKIYLTGPGALNLNVGSLYAYGQTAGANGTLGEPPAFSPQNSVGGYSTGYILTGVAPVPGSYGISTTVSVNGQNLNFSASATLPNSPVVLPPEPLPAWTSDGKGGGAFTMTNPAGVTESLIWIQAQNGAYVASVELVSPATSVSVPDGTLTVGATYYVFNVGADYPMVESAPPNSSVPNPTLTGSGGTADLTSSWYTTFTE